MQDRQVISSDHQKEDTFMNLATVHISTHTHNMYATAQHI